jgi:hypothetical protein
MSPRGYGGLNESVEVSSPSIDITYAGHPSLKPQKNLYFDNTDVFKEHGASMVLGGKFRLPNVSQDRRQHPNDQTEQQIKQITPRTNNVSPRRINPLWENPEEGERADQAFLSAKRQREEGIVMQNKEKSSRNNKGAVQAAEALMSRRAEVSHNLNTNNPEIQNFARNKNGSDFSRAGP